MVLVAGSGWGLPGEITVPVTLLHNRIIVPVWLNEVGPYPFLLDTTAPGNSVDDDTAGYLKLSGGQPEIRTAFIAPPTDLAQVRHYTVMDHNPFARFLGTPVTGILSPQSATDDICIDIPSGTVRFGNKNGWLPTGAPDVQPVVHGTINGQYDCALILDTTFGGVLGVPANMLRQWQLYDADVPCLVADRPDLKTVAAPLGDAQIRLKSLKCGAAEMTDPICTVLPETERPRLGVGFLHYFRATISPSEPKLTFESVKDGPAQCPPLVGCGVTPAAFNGKYWTIWVAERSPAARAGLLSGGILTHVAGQDAAGMDYDTVQSLLKGNEGSSVNVMVLQGDTALEKALPIERLL